jgi:hypothetical protein
VNTTSPVDIGTMCWIRFTCWVTREIEIASESRTVGETSKLSKCAGREKLYPKWRGIAAGVRTPLLIVRDASGEVVVSVNRDVERGGAGRSARQSRRCS